jgi:hypothetical protein
MLVTLYLLKLNIAKWINSFFLNIFSHNLFKHEDLMK